MIGWYIWIELDHAPSKASAEAAGGLMATAIRGAHLLHVQSKIDYALATEEVKAAKRNRKLKIRESADDDQEC